MRLAILLLQLFLFNVVAAQQASVTGFILDETGSPVPYATIGLQGGEKGTMAEEDGRFLLEDIPSGNQRLLISALGFKPQSLAIILKAGASNKLIITLENTSATLDEIVVTGTMKAVSRANSPVPVEVYTAEYFKANPTPSIFESLQTVNGVRPQLNCSVCNTGDIHINGLEGPYTMVLIDGMPIVSGLSTVYGLTGIPQSLIARTEVVKGPASTLYGSEAVGGLINVITRSPEDAPLFSALVARTGSPGMMTIRR